MGEIISLKNTNLIQYNELSYTLTINPEDKISYFDETIDVNGAEKICVGNIILSKAGQELMSVITDKRKIGEFAEFVGTIIKDMGGLLEGIEKMMQNKKVQLQSFTIIGMASEMKRAIVRDIGLSFVLRCLE